MTAVVQDLRYAFRTFARSPGFTIAVVVTLALGIGANTIVFSAVYGMWFKPLDYPGADRLVFLYSSNAALVASDPEGGWDRSNISANDFFDLRERAQSFTDMGICRYTTQNLTGGDRPERVIAARASASLLPTLGYGAMLGRVFTEEEDRPGHDRVVLLSERYWRARFHAEDGIVGQSISLDDTPYTVIGVLSDEMAQAWGRFPGVWDYFDVWMPFAYSPEQFDRTDRSFRAVGRLKPNVTLAAAQQEMTGIAARLEAAYPRMNRGYSVNVERMQDGLVGKEAKTALSILSLAVAFVLLIACVNVANLLLVRANLRAHEFAIRSALGARRLRIGRQLLTESAVLAALGGMIGTLLAVWGVALLVSIVPDTVARKDDIVVDAGVLLFTTVVSVLVAVAIGLVPALRSSMAAERIKSGGRSVSAGRIGRWGLDSLVVSQVSLALALVTCAGLMVKSFLNLRDLDPGFDARGVLTMRTSLSEARYGETAERVSFFDAVLSNVRATAEVESVAAVSTVPLDGLDQWSQISIEDRPVVEKSGLQLVGTVIVTDDYFKVMNIPLLRGRGFSQTDGPDGEQVVIISENLARHYWPDADPIGKRLKYGDHESLSDWRTVIGVVAPIRQTGLGREARMQTYRPFSQVPRREMSIVARTRTAPRAASLPIRAAIAAVDPDQPVYRECTMAEIVDREVGPMGVVAVLLGGFAAVALLLACIGLYGVMAYSVSGRTREIGIRLALGAKSFHVLWLVLSRALRLVCFGVAGGAALALLLGRTLDTLMFEVSPSDPVTMIQATVFLAAVGLFASYIPARRATLVDPVHALRAE